MVKITYEGKNKLSEKLNDWDLLSTLIISIFLIRLFGGMLGSMLGYGILIIISRVSLIFTNSILKMR